MTLKITDNQHGRLSQRQLGFLFDCIQQSLSISSCPTIAYATTSSLLYTRPG